MYIFSLTAGRTGSGYLSRLLTQNMPECEVYHERMGTDDWGVHTPEIGVMRRYNEYGIRAVADFWLRKLEHVAARPEYAELNHQLFKAGLVDALTQFGMFQHVASKTTLIVLKRDWFDTVLSYRHRGDFFNMALMWQYYLDPNYRLKLVDPTPIRETGLVDWVAVWYLAEMEARYKKCMEENPRLRFLEVSLEDIRTEEGARNLLSSLGHELRHLPPKVNASPVRRQYTDEDKLREVCKQWQSST